MLMLPDPHPKPATKTNAGKAKRRHPAPPHYHGRWPFIATADISGATQPSAASQRSAGTVAAVEDSEAPAELGSSTGFAPEDLDKVVAGIRRSPFQAMAIAAGVGFALGLIVLK
jgi:hypothetical protein